MMERIAIALMSVLYPLSLPSLMYTTYRYAKGYIQENKDRHILSIAILLSSLIIYFFSRLVWIQSVQAGSIKIGINPWVVFSMDLLVALALLKFEHTTFCKDPKFSNKPEPV